MSAKKGRTDPSVHTLAPITILANYEKVKTTGCKTELDDLVHAKFKSQQHGEFSSIITNGSTAPLVRTHADEESNYEPFEHRKLPHPTSDLDTLIHLLKGSLGSGILAMPLAFLNAGLAFGVVATVIIGAICTYCVHMLVTCAHTLYRRTRVSALDYAEVAEAAFAAGPEPVKKYRRLAKASVNMFLTIDLYGCCCVYIVFVATNLKQVVDYHTGMEIDLRFYMLSLLVPLILMNLIKNLKWMAPFSMIANILMATGLGITFYYIFTSTPAPSSETKLFSSFGQLPLFFGTVIFALEGIGVVMPLENNMKTPQHLIGCPSVLNIGMAIVVVLYASVGFFGYQQYGTATEPAITLNLPVDEILAQSVKVMIAVAIFLTYSLQFYVPMGIIWRNCQVWFPHWGLRAEYILRIFLVILSVCIACAFPDLGPFISLIGAVCLSMLGLIFPAIIETVTYWENPGLGAIKWRLWKNVFLFGFGILGFVTGTFSSLTEIAESFGTKH